jgi:hypothetical protein
VHTPHAAALIQVREGSLGPFAPQFLQSLRARATHPSPILIGPLLLFGLPFALTLPPPAFRFRNVTSNLLRVNIFQRHAAQPQDFYLYRSARAGLYGDFIYSVPLANGSYTVNRSGAVTVSAGSAGSATVNVRVALSATSTGGTPNLGSGGNRWFVTTSGSSSGDGSAAHAWDLATILSGPKSVQPGDTIWVRGGKYDAGQANSTAQQQPGGNIGRADHRPGVSWRAGDHRRMARDRLLWRRAQFRRRLYTWFWGPVFASFNPNRATGASGPPSYGAGQNHNSAGTRGAGTKYINCIVHDTDGGTQRTPNCRTYGQHRVQRGRLRSRPRPRPPLLSAEPGALSRHHERQHRVQQLR